MRTVRYHPEARAEFLHEVEYYAEISTRLAELYDKAVHAAEMQAATTPEAWPRWGRLTRRVIDRRFNFSLALGLTTGAAMAKRFVHMYTQLLQKPYKLGLKYVRIDDAAELYEIRRYYSYGDYVCGMLEILAKDDGEFLAKVSLYDDNTFMGSPHKTRRYIADRQDLLYIESPHLLEKYSRKVDAYWVVTNIGRREALAISSAAASSAGGKRSVWSKLVP